MLSDDSRRRKIPQSITVRFLILQERQCHGRPAAGLVLGYDRLPQDFAGRIRQSAQGHISRSAGSPPNEQVDGLCGVLLGRRAGRQEENQEKNKKGSIRPASEKKSPHKGTSFSLSFLIFKIPGFGQKEKGGHRAAVRQLNRTSHQAKGIRLAHLAGGHIGPPLQFKKARAKISRFSV
jgi:hypothetical protein